MQATRNPIPRTVSSLAAKVTEFWSHVDIRGDDECWPWMSYEEDGYGKFYFEGFMRGSHELALTFTTGEVRHPSLSTCHSCDNPPCCNPAHLRFDTTQSNVDDMISRGRAARSGRLTDEEVITIRVRRSFGARQIDLASQYGVSDSLISMIVRGVRWPNVGGPIEPKRNQYRRAS